MEVEESGGGFPWKQFYVSYNFLVEENYVCWVPIRSQPCAVFEARRRHWAQSGGVFWAWGLAVKLAVCNAPGKPTKRHPVVALGG